MKHGIGFLIVLVAFGLLIPVFVLLYRKLHAGQPQIGIHIQVLGVFLVWLAGVVAFSTGHVEFASGLASIGFVVGLLGLFLHTRKNRDDSD